MKRCSVSLKVICIKTKIKTNFLYQLKKANCMIKYYTGKDLRILVEVWLVQSVLCGKYQKCKCIFLFTILFLVILSHISILWSNIWSILFIVTLFAVIKQNIYQRELTHMNYSTHAHWNTYQSVGGERKREGKEGYAREGKAKNKNMKEQPWRKIISQVSNKEYFFFFFFKLGHALGCKAEGFEMGVFMTI